MRAQVDKLLTRVWHYFDTVVVRDVLTPCLLEGRSENIIGTFLTHLPPILYLREIGAEDLVEFIPKRDFHREDLEKHAIREGLASAFDSAGALMDCIRKTSTFGSSDDDGIPEYWMANAETNSNDQFGPQKLPRYDRKRAAAVAG
jgi:hypothetical protein